MRTGDGVSGRRRERAVWPSGTACLHGLGLCYWRLGELNEAAKTFTRMLWLNPSDNQGARFNLGDVEAGRTWDECENGDRRGN